MAVGEFSGPILMLDMVSTEMTSLREHSFLAFILLAWSQSAGLLK